MVTYRKCLWRARHQAVWRGWHQQGREDWYWGVYSSHEEKFPLGNKHSSKQLQAFILGLKIFIFSALGSFSYDGGQPSEPRRESNSWCYLTVINVFHQRLFSPILGLFILDQDNSVIASLPVASNKISSYLHLYEGVGRSLIQQELVFNSTC